MAKQETDKPAPSESLRERTKELLDTWRSGLETTPDRKVRTLVEELHVHQIELELQHQEFRETFAGDRLLREAISCLAEGVMVTGDDLDWPEPEIAFVNKAMCRMTGYEEEELVGQTPRVLMGAATDRQALDAIKTTVAAGLPCSVELTNYRKDGTPYDAEITITPFFNDEGGRCNFIAIHRDITKRKQTEQARREGEAYLRAVLETAVDAIITIDRRGIIQEVNPAAVWMFGYDREEMIGQNVNILMPSPYREEHDGYLERYHETGKAHIIGIGREVVAQRKDGSTFPVDLAVSKVEGMGLYTGIIRDITRRKKLEQEVINASEEERERIAHEIHDDLGSLLTGIKLETEGLVAALSRENIGLAEKGRGIARLIAEAVAKTRTIAHGLRPVGSDPEDLVGALLELSKRANALSGSEMQCLLDCPEPVLVDDPICAHNLYRIAQEAVNNAIKYSRGTKIIISLRNLEGVTKLRIEDDGRGFDHAADRGIGLGLRIMAYRANAVKGTLGIERGSAGGTCVVCTVQMASTPLSSFNPLRPGKSG